MLLPRRDIPKWLENLNDTSGPIPLAEILTDSVYYPCSGFDGNPVQVLAHSFHSFVYADCGFTSDVKKEYQEAFRAAL